MPLKPGQVLNHRYRIAKLLGQGGFGAVYKAWDLNLARACALKENTETSQAAQAQFFNEAKILSHLRHPGLPLVSDHFIVPGQGQYLVMDFVDGHDLEELLEQAGGHLPEAQVLDWIGQVCDALSYLHRQMPPVIHRDIKPANIKITPDNRAMLVDFGIAKTFNPQLKTTLGARAVTPGYSPIEQYGQGMTDFRSDIYSLGATLYKLLTGVDPPEAPTRAARDSLVRPSQVNLMLHPQVEAVILKALQMDPDERFQSVGEFKYEISGKLAVASHPLPLATQVRPRPIGADANAATLSPSPLSPATMGVPLPPPTRSFPWKWVGVGAGLLVGFALLAVVAGIFYNGAQENRLTNTAQARGTQTAAALLVTRTEMVGVVYSPTRTPAITPSRSPTETPTPTLSHTPTKTPTITLTPSPTSTPIGGGSGYISFTTYRDGNIEIYLINVDGSGVTRLMGISAFSGYPSWSPDGRQIAFTSHQNGNSEIYVMNADGSEQIRLTNNPSLDLYPSWSPDGSRIAFTSYRDGNGEIYVMNADGSDVTRLTNHSWDDRYPAWSPDGSQIVSVADQGDIYVVNADGSGFTRLTTNGGKRLPMWSPDSRQIVFVWDMDPDSEIYVINADGSGQTCLTYNNAYDGAPAWSPDGRQIAFTSRQDGNAEIYVMDADGRGKINLTNEYAADSDPIWSPDGRLIAFESYRDGSYGIYIMHPDGSGVTRLSVPGTSSGEIIWVP